MDEAQGSGGRTAGDGGVVPLRGSPHPFWGLGPLAHGKSDIRGLQPLDLFPSLLVLMVTNLRKHSAISHSSSLMDHWSK